MIQKPATHVLRRILTHTVTCVLTIALIATGIFWMQFASTRGKALGYPAPHVQIVPLASNALLTNQSQQFSSTATGRGLSYNWVFSDQNGTSVSGPTVRHVFQQNGSFTVTVTVTDATGQSSSDSLSVTVAPPPPTALFTYSAQGFGFVSFDATGSQADPSTTITAYNWDFGDGATDSTTSAQDSHTYSATGTFTVTLIVIDAAGQSSQPYASNIVVS